MYLCISVKYLLIGTENESHCLIAAHTQRNECIGNSVMVFVVLDSHNKFYNLFSIMALKYLLIVAITVYYYRLCYRSTCSHSSH